MPYEIRSDVKIPAKQTKATNKKYLEVLETLKLLSVNDSFVIPEIDDQNRELAYLRSTLSVYSRMLGIKIVTRYDRNKKELSVWCTA